MLNRSMASILMVTLVCMATGVETTRHFLLEWLSYTYRYVPVGLLDVIPQRLNWRPPSYFGRDDLETLMASESAADWVWTFTFNFVGVFSCDLTITLQGY